MKRSRKIQLVVMASTAVTLAGCSDEPQIDGTAYKNETDCLSQNQISDQECKTVIQAGQTIHKESGPKYNTKSLCNQEHGTDICYKNETQTGAFYTPLPAGYFLALAPISQALEKRVRPIYTSRQRRGYYTSGGYLISHHSNSGVGGSWRTSEKAIKTAPKPAKVQTRTSVASRGGFGGRSRSGFSFGG